MTEPTIIDDLMGDLPPRAFLDDHYLRLPFARAGGCSSLVALGGWDVVDRLAGISTADVIVGRGGQQQQNRGPVNPAQVRQFLDEGQTTGFRHAHLHDEGLAHLAARFQLAFGAPVDIHLYCTPAGQPGFGWHYDAEEVFVLQTAGSKEWRLRKNTVHPWPVVESIPIDQQYEREIMPVFACLLQAGDWLYVPGGYWHDTAAGEESLSLSIGIQALTALDALDFLRARLASSIEWRQRLPPTGAAFIDSAEQRPAAYCAIFDLLGRQLASAFSNESLIQSFLNTVGHRS